MDQGYNFFHFEAEFRKYLVALNVEKSTLKGYLSDLRYFFSWLESRIQSTAISYSAMSQVFSHGTVADYYEYINAQGTNEKTALRRVAAIRKFFSFCVKQQWLSENPATSWDNRKEKQEQDALVHTYLTYLQSKHKNIDLGYYDSLIKEFIHY